MSAFRITITRLQSGQPRPYADSEYTAEILFEYEPWDGQAFKQWKYGKDDHIRSLVIKLSKQFVHDWVYKTPERQWYEAYLEELTEKEPGKWFVHIIEPYTD